MNYASEPYLNVSTAKLVDLLLTKNIRNFVVALNYNEGLVIKSECNPNVIYARATSYNVYDPRLEYCANPHIMCVSIFLNMNFFYTDEKKELIKLITEEMKQLTTDEFVISAN